MARGVNLDGDDQADRKAHGGPDKAIYAYAIEDYRWWESELGQPLATAAFGENLTLEGVELTRALVGEQWEVGTLRLEVSEPRVPCWRLGVRMDDKLFPKRFTEGQRPGTYLRIIDEGNVGAGDTIRLVSQPEHDLSIGDVFAAFTGRASNVEKLLEVPQLSEPWRAWARKRLERKSSNAPTGDSPSCC